MAGHDSQSESGRQALRTDGLRRCTLRDEYVCIYIGCPEPNEKYSKKDGNMRWERDILKAAKNDRDSSPQRNIKV